MGEAAAATSGGRWWSRPGLRAAREDRGEGLVRKVLKLVSKSIREVSMARLAEASQQRLERDGRGHEKPAGV